MKVHHILAAAVLIPVSNLAFAHPGGHDDDVPSTEECAQLRKLAKADAEKPAMQDLKQQCDATYPEKADKPADRKPAR